MVTKVAKANSQKAEKIRKKQKKIEINKEIEETKKRRKSDLN